MAASAGGMWLLALGANVVQWWYSPPGVIDHAGTLGVHLLLEHLFRSLPFALFLTAAIGTWAAAALRVGVLRRLPSLSLGLTVWAAVVLLRITYGPRALDPLGLAAFFILILGLPVWLGVIIVQRLRRSGFPGSAS